MDVKTKQLLLEHLLSFLSDNKRSRFKEIVTIGNKERDNIILKNITSGKTPRDIEYLDVTEQGTGDQPV